MADITIGGTDDLEAFVIAKDYTPPVTNATPSVPMSVDGRTVP